jgi:hypothetical protein
MRAFHVRIVVPMFSVLVTALVVSAAQAEPNSATPAAATKSDAKKPAARTDVSVGAALARLDKGVTLVPTTTAPNPGTMPATTTMTMSRPSNEPSTADLANVRVTKQGASDRAGEARNVELTVGTGAGPAKPVASVRHERKLAVAKTMASLAPAFEACRAKGGVSPGATVAVRIEIAPAGAVERAEVASVTGATTKEGAQCLASAFEGAKFGPPGGQGVQMTLPVTVTAPHAPEPPAPIAAADRTR